MIKKTIRRILRRHGFDIVRVLGTQHPLGLDPFLDMQHFLHGQESPVVFDVGANVGQSVAKFKEAFPTSTIHSFEPSPSTYEQLKSRCENISGVTAWNLGVGGVDTTLTFQENEQSDMSSFLPPGELCWGKVVKSTDVRIVTLDSFASDQNAGFVHVLKSDTQGYDFEVIKGAHRLMTENRIGLIYFEFIFSEMYKELPSFDVIFRYLSDHNFALVTYYSPHFQEDLLSWTDLLFVNREFNRKRLDQGAARAANSVTLHCRP